MIDSTFVSGIRDDQRVDGQHAQQALAAVDDEHLVRLRRQFVEAPQVTQHDFERHVRPHGDVLEVHQRADHVVVEGHRGAQLLALLDRQALEHIVHHLLREVGREIGDLVGFERLRRGDELLGIHRRDQRLADRVGDLEQDVAVARGPHAIPDVHPLVERKRFEDVGDVGRMQPVELALQRGGALLVDRAFGELGVAPRPAALRVARRTSPSTSRCWRRRSVTRASASCTLFGVSVRDATAVSTGSAMVLMRARKEWGRKMRLGATPMALLRPRTPRQFYAGGRSPESQGITAPGMRARIVATRPSR